MRSEQPRYRVYNRTDGVPAAPYSMTREEAEEFVRLYPKRFEQQGYYLTASGHRISAESVELEIVADGVEQV